jgi:hypothetical protein
MIWLTWRQHRAEGLILLVVLALVGVFLLMTGLAMASSFQQLQLNHCLDPNTKSGACAVLLLAFYNQYDAFQPGVLSLLALPLLLGALVGAPLVAQEVERRTHLLVWTQSVTRLRWLRVKLALVLGAGLLGAGALLAALRWWSAPLVQLHGSFSSSIYDTSGPVWVATTLLGLALGIFAGTLTRHTVVAIFVTIALFVAIRAPVELVWRPNFEAPLTATYSPDQQNPPGLSNQDWQFASGYIDAQGHRNAELNCTRDQTPAQCLRANDVQAFFVTYQPANRFWTFQWIETGIYVVFSALALVAAIWLVRRRLI